jgi:hypothetical protein
MIQHTGYRTGLQSNDVDRVVELPTPPTAAEVERWRADAARAARRSAATRLANWDLGGFTLEDLERLRAPRFVD